MTLMPHVLILLHVDDCPAWKAVFDGAADLRHRAGECTYRVLLDPNLIVHVSTWTSLDAGRL
jgi:hypothetical protein